MLAVSVLSNAARLQDAVTAKPTAPEMRDMLFKAALASNALEGGSADAAALEKLIQVP
jgi:hypothetical protein